MTACKAYIRVYNVSFRYNLQKYILQNLQKQKGKGMKTFKGFNKDMTCRDFQYEEGKEYTHDGKVKACDAGFHACEDAIDCFAYYPPATSVYHEVEQSGEISKGGDDTKVASSKIKIGGQINVLGIAKAHIEYVKAHTNFEHTDPKQATAGNYGAATAGDSGAATAGYSGAATAGDSGAATAGDRGAATAGYSGAATAGDSGAATAGDRGAATAGNYGAATAGDSGAATAGYSGAATAGDSGAATAGDRGAATAGNYGAATAGDSGAATSRGSSSVGKEGIACARGNGCKVKGGLGAVLVLVEENSGNYGIKAWKAEVVDGERIKADTFYTLKDGEFVEVENA